MRQPSIDRLPARTKIASQTQRFILRFGIAWASMAFWIFAFPIHARCQSRPAATITVLVYNYARVSETTLVAAEHEANRIVGIAGARVDWIECQTPLPEADPKDLCRRGWTAQIPGLRLIRGSNNHQNAEFASTAIPVLITLYYEHVVRRAYREHADAGVPRFLGCIMAHELGHILLSNPVHSATGIMQPEWGHPQFHQAMTGNLLFTGPQAARIRAQAYLLASLRSNADAGLLPSTP
ncbi:MAG TPA: hypothetical protein VFE61_02555 [Candidatus Sulfotelmatobacter sp.]|nr:hypothetical protein [Candidatus Sulfotelmatobacter sp.]